MRAHRTAGLILGLLSVAHLQLLSSVALGSGTEPVVLVVGHTLALGLAIAGAVGAFGSRRWAWKLVLGYGSVVAAMILLLPLALELSPRAWWQLVPAAALVLGVAGLGANRLRRILAPA